jgi:hypothetical protein
MKNMGTGTCALQPNCDSAAVGRVKKAIQNSEFKIGGDPYPFALVLSYSPRFGLTARFDGVGAAAKRG